MITAGRRGGELWSGWEDTALTTVTVSASATTSLQAVTSSGAQSYTAATTTTVSGTYQTTAGGGATISFIGPVVLGGNVFLTTNNDAGSFGSTLDGTSAGGQNLTITVGTAAVTASGAVGMGMAIGTVTISSGTLDVTNSSFAITTLANSGFFRLTGEQATQSIGIMNMTGTVQYYDGVGNGTIRPASFFDLEIVGPVRTFALGQAITVGPAAGGGTLRITNGILDANASDITLYGDWNNTQAAANFLPQNRGVFFKKPSGTINVSGDNNWFVFSYSVVPAGPVTFMFQIGKHQAMTNNSSSKFELLGTAVNRISITSTGMYWFFDLPALATLNFANVDIHNSFANQGSGVSITVPITGCTADASDVNWKFTVDVLFSQTEDLDHNGKIDRIRVKTATFIGTVGQPNFGNFSVTVTGYSLRNNNALLPSPRPYELKIDSAEDPAAASLGNDEFWILVQEKPGLDTDTTPSWIINVNTTLKDTANDFYPVALVTSPATPLDKAPPILGYTLAISGTSQMFVHFSEPVFHTGGTPLVTTDFSFVTAPLGGITASVITPITFAGSGISEALITLNRPLTGDDFTLPVIVNVSNAQDGAAVANPLLIPLGHRISDIGLGPVSNGLIEPVIRPRSDAVGSVPGRHRAHPARRIRRHQVASEPPEHHPRGEHPDSGQRVSSRGHWHEPSLRYGRSRRPPLREYDERPLASSIPGRRHPLRERLQRARSGERNRRLFGENALRDLLVHLPEAEGLHDPRRRFQGTRRGGPGLPVPDQHGLSDTAHRPGPEPGGSRLVPGHHALDLRAARYRAAARRSADPEQRHQSRSRRGDDAAVHPVEGGVRDGDRLRPVGQHHPRAPAAEPGRRRLRDHLGRHQQERRQGDQGPLLRPRCRPRHRRNPQGTGGSIGGSGGFPAGGRIASRPAWGIVSAVSVLRWIHTTLTSVRLALVLIAIIILLAVVGTLIPQGMSDAWYASRYAPAMAAAVRVLRLGSFYSSALFLVPVCLFTLSLVFCTVTRFTRQARSRGPRRHGPDLIHIGLLVLVAGGLVTALGRQEQTFALVEGDEASIGSGYHLALRSLQFQSYSDGSPRDWISTVGVTRDGRPEVSVVPIRVNHPLRLGGITVYQSSWDVSGALRLRDKSGAAVPPPNPGDYFMMGDSRWVFAGFLHDGPGWSAAFVRFQDRELVERRNLRPGDAVGPFTVAAIDAHDRTGLKVVRDPGRAVVLRRPADPHRRPVPHVPPETGRYRVVMATLALIIVVVAAVFQAGFLLRRENRRGSGFSLAARRRRGPAAGDARPAQPVDPLRRRDQYLRVSSLLLRGDLRGALRPEAGAPDPGFSPFVLFGATVIALALLAISSSPLAPSGVQPPIPALRSYWLVLHVTFSFIGEALFVVSFVAAIAWFAARGEERRADLDRLVSASIGVGYPVFTAGALVFGSIWAETAWGAWWSWDPKETWALVTWLVYTAYLHTRLAKSLRGKVSSLLAIIGFAATLFTFLGVNFLLSGLHSYG